MERLFKKSLLGCAVALLLVSCGGNTDGGDPTNEEQPSIGNSGSMSLSFTNGQRLTTGSFQGFRVKVRDANGQPSSNVRVTCDTESGLALIEPTSGFATTDGNGEFSGKVGCENPGSFLMACRAGSPGARTSETIICEGARPSGFSGFPGAGGGSLGGGSADGGTTSRVRITSVSVSDDGSDQSSTTSIDIVQDACDEGGTPVPEPFFDSSVRFNIVNNTSSIVRITEMSYVLAGPTGSGASTSSRLSVTGSASSAVDASGGSGTVSSLLFDATSGGKRVVGGPIITSEGFKNITFTLYGENELGETFTIRTATALSFDNFNNCSN